MPQPQQVLVCRLCGQPAHELLGRERVAEVRALSRVTAQTHQQISQQNQQSWTQAKNVSGRAVSASNDEVLVRSSDQGDLRLKLNDSTAVTVDGQMGSADQIKPGEDVRASYQVIDGQPTATKIEVRSSQSSTSNPKQ